MKRTIIAMLMAIMCLGVGRAQLPSSFPPKSYPASILVVTDPGVAKYWDVKRIMYLGPGNGGHKFRVFGTAKSAHSAANINMYYIKHDNKLQIAGGYFFPEVKAGDAFNFDIVSAFPGNSPKSFVGFMIKDDMFPSEQDVPEVPEEILKTVQVSQIKTVDKEDIRAREEEEEIRASDILKDDKVYNDVEVAASFPGGMSALKTWLGRNIHYPEEAQSKNVQGRVVVSFIVEKDGSISNVRVTKSVDKNLDKEALRVVRNMPRWNPAKKNEMPVRAYYNIPINFNLTSTK